MKSVGAMTLTKQMVQNVSRLATEQLSIVLTLCWITWGRGYLTVKVEQQED